MSHSLLTVLGACLSLQLVSGFVFELYTGGLIDSELISSGGVDNDDIANNMPNISSEFAIVSTRTGDLDHTQWTVHEYFLADNKSTVDAMNSVYSDVKVARILEQQAVGNLIVCPGCGVQIPDLIGYTACVQSGCPYAYIYRLFPLYMNAVWGLSNSEFDASIVSVGTEDDDYLIITAYFYNIYAEDSTNYDPINGLPNKAIPNKLFPNATSTGAVSGSDSYFNNTRSGIVYARYNDIDIFFADLGDPNDFATLYNEYYWRQDNSENYYYIYGFSIECSNNNIWLDLQNGPTTTTPAPTMGDSTSGSSNIIYGLWVLSYTFLFFCMQ